MFQVISFIGEILAVRAVPSGSRRA
jgi:hypothetical protein